MVGVPTEPSASGGTARRSSTPRSPGTVAASGSCPSRRAREERLADLLDGVEQNHYSWTWPVPDDVRRAAVAELPPVGAGALRPARSPPDARDDDRVASLRPPRLPAPRGLTSRYPYGSVRHSRAVTARRRPRGCRRRGREDLVRQGARRLARARCVLSHALHYGTGVFEGIRAYATDRGPAVWHLEERLKRLFRSAKLYHMDIPYSHEALTEARGRDSARTAWTRATSDRS